MGNVDFFNKAKEELVAQYFRSFFQSVNIIELVGNYPNLVNEVNLSETFNKLLNIRSVNYDSLKTIINYMNDIDNKNGVFYKEDLKDIFSNLKDSLDLQDILYISMIDYILVNENVIDDEKEANERLDNYSNSDNLCLKMVKENNKQLKKIINENI